MKTLVEAHEGEKNTVKLSVEIGEDEFEPAIDAAFRKIAREVRIPGFRPGKTPRRILEQRVGKGYARAQAIEDSLPEFYVRSITENDVDVINQPQLDLTGGMESGPITFTAIVETRPKVRVPGYDGLQVTIPSPAMTDEEIDAQVDRLRERFAVMGVVDRQAYPGDSVTIDIAGSVDGEAIDSLTAEDYLYEVGSNAVVPELDAALTGVSAGAALEFDAPVPNDPDTTIHFTVTVKSVHERNLPEATDEWAASTSEFTTMADLRADIAKRAGLMKRLQASMAMREETVKALIELVDGDEEPEVLVNQEIGRRLDDMAQRLYQQGASIEQYLQMTGTTEEQLIEQMRPQAVESVRADLALRAVVEAESIEASDDDINVEIARLADRFKMKPAKVRSNLERSFQMPILAMDIRKAKAVTWLTEHATAVDSDGKTIDRELLSFDATSFADDVIGSSVDVDDDGHDHDHDHEGHDHSH